VLRIRTSHGLTRAIALRYTATSWAQALKPREVLDTTTTPTGESLVLARERGHCVIRMAGVPLMTSATYGSEQAMASIAAEALGERPRARVLVGGLGMGFTVRAALDSFQRDARITVAELLPPLVGYNRGVLGHLADHPLRSRRVRLFQGDVRIQLQKGGWDAILMDVDNGPDALTSPDNASLYGDDGVALMARSLTRGGLLVVWSAYPDRRFAARLRRADLRCETRRVHARGAIRKGPRHTLFIAQSP